MPTVKSLEEGAAVKVAKLADPDDKQPGREALCPITLISSSSIVAKRHIAMRCPNNVALYSNEVRPRERVVRRKRSLQPWELSRSGQVEGHMLMTSNWTLGAHRHWSGSS